MRDGSRPIIAFRSVGKKFVRGRYHDTLRDLLADAARSVLRTGTRSDRGREFWALEDVSFEVAPGEVLGVIGPNGAGKSTLLKLAAGILRPDRGHVEVRGRVGALVELVAGFHSELTGRENVYLQGAVMGMERADIDRKFDRIVEFAGVGEFIDTPVKRYSSGMEMRLGFSIAAHMEPDALLVDEILTVGDLEFQRRARDRLREIVRRDVPVVLVSHQLERIADLCSHALLLVGGRVAHQGPPSEVIAAYVGEQDATRQERREEPVALEDVSAPEPRTVPAGERVRLRIRGSVAAPDAASEVTVGVRIRSLPDERIVFASNGRDLGCEIPDGGDFELEVDLAMNLGPGLYRVQAMAWNVSDGLECSRGPSAVVRVEPRQGSYGTAFLAPRMSLLELRTTGTR